MAIIEITPKTLEKAQIVLPLAERVLDIFRSEQSIRVEWTDPEYRRVEILWGLIRIERGARQTFIIKGKPGFCAAVIAELHQNGKISHSTLLPPGS